VQEDVLRRKYFYEDEDEDEDRTSSRK